MSASLGLGMRWSSAAADMIWPGLAVAALHHVDIEPGFLDALARWRLRATASMVVIGFLADGAHRQHARAHRLAVEVHRAGAALRDAAAELGAGQADDVAQDPEQRHVLGGVEGMGLAVDVEIDHGPRLFLVRRGWQREP